jgi:hypothetical protein
MADRGKGTFIGSLWSRARSSSKSRSGEKAVDSPLRPDYSDESDQSGYCTSRPSSSRPKKSRSPVTNIFEGMTSGLRGRKPRRTVRPGTTVTIEEPGEWPTRTPLTPSEDGPEEDEEELLPRVSDDDVPSPAAPEQPQQERGSSEERRDAPDSPDESVPMTIDVNELSRLHRSTSFHELHGDPYIDSCLAYAR